MLTALLRRRVRSFVIAFLLLSSLLVTSIGFVGDSASVAIAQTSPQRFLTEGIESTVLDNGLTVLMKPVRSAPVVSIQVAYGVGPVDEEGGESGLSHQVEHMLFKGTEERPIQFGRLFSALGSEFNAFVADDQTIYFNTVGREKLNAILTLEADRMLNAQMTAEELDTEKQVVISELQGYENNPGYLLSRAVMQAAYPDRAYGQPIGGTTAAVEGFTQAQVAAFYEKYYSPSNAALIIVGDFDVNATLGTIETLFGSLANPETATPRPTGLIEPAEAIPMTAQTGPLVLQLPGALPLVEVVFPLPNFTHPDSPTIDVLDTLLTQGRSSRLYQALVDTGIANSVGSIPKQLREPGWYTIQAVGKPGQSPEAVYEALQQGLAQVMTQPVDPSEVAKAKEQYKALFGFLSQEITSQGRLLGLVQTTAGGYRAIDDYLAAIEAVTPEDVLRVAQAYLSSDKAVVGFFEHTVNAPQPPPSVGTEPAERFAPEAPVSPAEVAEYLPPLTDNAVAVNQALPEKVVLENGLQVLLLQDNGAPTVTMSGWVDAGDRYDPDGKAGTALLTAVNLASGTDSKDALTLAQTTEGEGIQFSAETDLDGANLNMSMLSEDLSLGLETLADVLQNSVFPDDMFTLTQQQLGGQVAASLTSPAGVSSRVFQQAVYPEAHPAHQVTSLESVGAIAPTDLQTFYNQHYRPDNTIITFVGDFDSIQLKSQLTLVFGDWQSEGAAPTAVIPSVPLPESSVRLKETLVGSSEAVTIMGYNAISRDDPRFYALSVVNEVLGGSAVSSRLGDSLRDQQGLTYGVTSQIQSGTESGPLIISMQTAPEDVEQAVDSAIAVLQQIKTEGITAEELQSAKRSIADRYPIRLAEPGFLSFSLLRNTVNQLDEREIQTYPEKIQAVTLADAQAVIEDFIQPDKLVIVTAGPNT